MTLPRAANQAVEYELLEKGDGVWLVHEQCGMLNLGPLNQFAVKFAEFLEACVQTRDTRAN